MNKLIGVMAVLLTAGLMSLPLVLAGDIDIELNTEGGGGEQHNVKVPQDFAMRGTYDVSKGDTKWVYSDGTLKGSLNDAVLYQIAHDGNLLLQVHSLNEDACDWFAEVDGSLMDISSTGLIKIPSVDVGQKFGLRFNVKNADDLNCSLNYDLNIEYWE